jgi:hypothetical protein
MVTRTRLNVTLRYIACLVHYYYYYYYHHHHHHHHVSDLTQASVEKFRGYPKLVQANNGTVTN